MRVPSFIIAWLLVWSACFADQDTVCRAAIDIGSGCTKLCVAVVDIETGRTNQILFGEEYPIHLGLDLKERKDGTLSDKILLDLEEQVRRYRNLAWYLGAEKIVGIATAVFREATNGRAAIEKINRNLGSNIRVIPQEEEGNIGFLTAVAASGKECHEVIAWDSGGASFQITYRDGEKLSVYKGAWGGSKVVAEMIQTVQGREFTATISANPATVDDVIALCEIIKQTLPPVSSGLQNKLQELDGSVVGLSGGTSIFDMARIALGKDVFNKEEVWSAIESLAGKTDEELIDYPERKYVMPKFALLYTVMDHFGINSVQCCSAIGSTLGMFMEKSYWEEERQQSAR
jgi:exopolyphosphatase/guanosine-5'-triphosphate,3'-diphosphate pyrophosphatase